MTLIGAGGPACREIRQLLGVYVVGAIDPAERGLVDEHLGECSLCRDELAGLAGLPAMLSRVPEADVARLGVTSLPDPAEPSPDMLNSLLKRVAARRRSRMYRGAFAVAAAAVIAAGGTATAIQLAGTAASSGTAAEVASGINQTAHITAVVEYQPAPSGTSMKVQVSGIRPGTACKFWVVTRSGQRADAGSWTVGTYGLSPWYPGKASVSPTTVHAFQITAAGKVLVTIPAS